MPSDRPVTYLRNVLVSGAVPFRYRSGIRTLLGLPENLDSRIAYPSALPLPGFKYLSQPAFNEVEIDTSRMVSESGFPESEDTEHPKTPQRDETKETPSTVETRDAAAIRVVQESLSRAEPLKPSVRPSRETSETSEPALTDRKAAQPKIEHATAEQLRIDIPGVSEKQLSFPALESRKLEETTRSSETPTQVPAVLDKQEQQPPAAIKPPNAALMTRSGAGEKSVTAPRLPSRGPAVLRHDDPRSALPTPELKATQKRASAGEELAETASPHRSTLPLTSPKQAAQGPASSVQPWPQRAAEAQIEQLRQRLSILKRKTASNLRQSQNLRQAEPAEMNRPASPAPQQVVIVNRSQPLRQSPPAFWERSHLSQFLRLRRLR